MLPSLLFVLPVSLHRAAAHTLGRGVTGLPRRALLVSQAGGRASAAVTQASAEAKAKPSSMDLNPPRGTRDFYPGGEVGGMGLRSWLFEQWRTVAAQHGFEEYDAPVLETEELYVRKAGEDVTNQLYSLEDRSGRRLALRPEMTPSLARMVLARRGGLPLPLKWFSIPQCWRYERTTRGRRREHFQWNLDIWGVEELTAEAELLHAAVSFMRRVGLTSADVGIKVSTRAVLAELLSKIGLPNERFAETCVLIDKLDKLPEEEVRQALLQQGLSDDGVSTLLSTLKLVDFATLEEAMGADSPALTDLKRVFSLADAYGLSDWLVLDISVVRGLAYYTGVVFEGFDRSGELRAIFGGGRYDKLLSTFGGDDLPAAGFGFGDAVIMELLESKKLLPDLPTSMVDAVVFAMNDELLPQAMQLASTLRAAGRNVDMVLQPKKTKWIFKHADRLDAKFVVLLAPQEAEKGLVRVKNLGEGTQIDVEFASIVSAVPAQCS
mmetsp:Transcript_16244/g.40964  ORF Transcript_16244/g.40964 Transcript_16244/m.40964 type:complete len:493 (-) Transcript_16244:133-1611(-)